jgi:hypothetical protein
VALTVGPAAALPPGTAPTTGQNLTVPAGATSASDYQLTLSTGNNFCPGDGLAGFRWATYMVPASVDAATLTYTPAGPSAGTGVFAQPLFSSAGSPQVAKTPGIGDGLISGIPANFSMASIAGLPVPNGVYKIGFACYKAGVTERYWQSTITVSGSTATSFNWVKGSVPGAPTGLTATGASADGGQITGTLVAPAGAGPCPQTTRGSPDFASSSITGTSPPGPFKCGSTTCRTNAAATPASNAFPPRSRMDIPTAVAIQCVVVTTPNVPSISGRVVKGLGLTKDMRGRPRGLLSGMRQLIMRTKRPKGGFRFVSPASGQRSSAVMTTP